MMESPCERDTFQESEEKWWVAKGGKATADVGNKENKKDHRVDAIFTIVVGLK